MDKEANYCPYCAEPLGNLRYKRIRTYFWLGFAMTLIGVIIVVFVQPQINYESSVFPEAPLELWISGCTSLVFGLGLIAYSYYLKERERRKTWTINEPIPIQQFKSWSNNAPVCLQ
jgi:hypothetical protein